MTSYIEARGGKYNSVVVFGLQAFLIKVLSKPLTTQMVEDATGFLVDRGHIGFFNYDGFMDIVNKLGGRWPIEIKCVPEGFVVDKKVVIATIRNTDPRFAWVVSYIETMILRALWYPCTVATKSFLIRKMIMEYLSVSSDDPDSINFMLLDFGARGVSSAESAQIGGAAHLAVGWLGSDTIEGINAFNLYYDSPMSGFSVAASEHSTMTVWGEDNEPYAIGKMISKYGYDQNGSGKIVSCVLDSYDYYRALEDYVGTRYNAEIRKLGAAGGRFVCRPDSGDPVEVVCKSLEILYRKFEDDCHVNSLGYKVLPPYLRILFADGINSDDINKICTHVLIDGFSIENVLFGMGGGLLQDVTRDDAGFAMKTCHAVVKGEARNVSKNPKTADGTKSSKSGEHTTILLRQSGNIESIPIEGENSKPVVDFIDILFTVYKDGNIVRTYTAEEVRSNVDSFI
jgi:nicotinamide phosphoribosyltransferase